MVWNTCQIALVTDRVPRIKLVVALNDNILKSLHSVVPSKLGIDNSSRYAKVYGRSSMASYQIVVFCKLRWIAVFEDKCWLGIESKFLIQI
jgi:hypothetical protein